MEDYVNIAYNTDTFANPSTDNHPAGTNYYSVSGQSIKSVSNGICTITRKDDSTGDASILIKHGNETNNKVYLRVMVRTTTSGVNAFCGGTLGNIVNDGEWHLVSCIVNDTKYASNFLAINCGNTTNGSGFDIKEFMKIDLTAMYGTGKEPSKAVCDATFTTYKSGLVG